MLRSGASCVYLCLLLIFFCYFFGLLDGEGLPPFMASLTFTSSFNFTSSLLSRLPRLQKFSQSFRSETSEVSPCPPSTFNPQQPGIRPSLPRQILKGILHIHTRPLQLLYFPKENQRSETHDQQPNPGRMEIPGIDFGLQVFYNMND